MILNKNILQMDEFTEEELMLIFGSEVYISSLEVAELEACGELRKHTH